MKIENLEDLLSDLVQFQNKNQNATLNDFLEFHLTQIYKETLLDFVGHRGNKLIGRIDFLEDLANGNKLLDGFLKMNYYFDQIFLLNLDKNKDKLNKSGQSLGNVGIFNWSRFKTLNGNNKINLQEWKEYQQSEISNYDKRIYGGHAISNPQSWATLKSIYGVIQKAKQNGYQRILILQDDIMFHHNFIGRFLKIVKGQIIPSDWKLLYLGTTQQNWDQEMENNMNDKSEFKGHGINYYLPKGFAEGAFAVGIDSSVFDDLLAEIRKFDLPFDHGPLCTIQKKYPHNCFVIKPNLIIANGFSEMDSDRFKWDYRDYHRIE